MKPLPEVHHEIVAAGRLLDVLPEPSVVTKEPETPGAEIYSVAPHAGTGRRGRPTAP